MAEDNESFYNQKHTINITLASQLRLHDILNKIVEVDSKYPMDTAEKQKCKLELVKQYVISAVPYLSKYDAEEYGKEVLGFSIKSKSNVRKGSQRFSYDFDPKLDKRLNEILIELQIKLRPILTRIKDDDDDDGL